MADVFTREKRSDVMSRIRSDGTRIEDRLFQIVREALGYRWRINRNVGHLPGKPDVVVPSLAVAVFADGCFFHYCPQHGRIPDSNREYWEPKLRRNVSRDLSNRRKLRLMGFAVWRVWEHNLRVRDLERTQAILGRRFTKRRSIHHRRRYLQRH